MQFVSLASSSKGNCHYIDSTDGAVLIDCGISTSRISKALADLGHAPDRLCGVFITHEHSDHIAGLEVFLKRYRVPCYASEGTLAALERKGLFEKVPGSLLHALDDGDVRFGALQVRWTPISHDAAEPLSYMVVHRHQKIGMMTDVGRLSEDNLKALHDSDLLYMEANHDPELLRLGRYPVYLQKRIRSAHGHLSNEQCAAGLLQTMTPRTRHVILGHLSEENNRPRLAFEAIRSALLAGRASAERIRLWVADPRTPLSIDLAPQCDASHILQ